jgi:acetyl-CoA/propionyl-CoA carboxylase biotin carboxyl carrier protein
MLAKVIAWGPDRPTALERLARALDETVVLGVVTNLRFLRWLVRQPVVLDGQTRTDTLDRIWPPDDWAARVVIPESAWSEAARVLATTEADAGDPWAGGWRLNGTHAVRVEADGEIRGIELTTGVPTTTTVALTGDVVHLDLAGRSTTFRLAAPPDVDRAARAAVAHGIAGTGPSSVEAPMPGAVLSVHVAAGQVVAIGDPMVTLEAMKMEHAVTAPITGRVAEIAVRSADQVTRGQLLAIIEPLVAISEPSLAISEP